ncbi:hypothetical protein IF803_19085 [Bradyrhizobium sp. UFLA06-06]
MSDVFPSFTVLPLKDALPGSIVRIGRYDGCKIALVTNHVVNGTRSFVWLNPGFKNRAPVIFAENWQNDSPVLQYTCEARFELGMADDDIDPSGHNVWETAGVIVAIGDELFIRAAPYDDFYAYLRLVNVRDGSVYAGELPRGLWTFLSWQLWIRDTAKAGHFMLTEFRLPHPKK